MAEELISTLKEIDHTREEEELAPDELMFTAGEDGLIVADTEGFEE